MTGPEHYREAEHLLAVASKTTDWDAAHVARAQVHATLALVAASVGPLDVDPWVEVLRLCGRT